MTEGATPPEGAPDDVLHPDALRALSLTFGQQLAPVLRAHSRIEKATREKNVIGRQNLVEAFSHLGVLFAKAGEFDRDQQLEQVAHLRDHLRRVMMESFELDVYVVLGSLWDDEDSRSIGRRYDAQAAPLIKRGKLLGHISPEELQERLAEIEADVVVARQTKVADGDFSDWEKASDSLEDAGTRVRGLKRELGAAVDAADAHRSNLRRWAISLGVGVTLAIASNILTHLL